MIIQCEQCQTRFKVGDDKVANGPIKVRCSKCGHIFQAGAGPAPETSAVASTAGGTVPPGFPPPAPAPGPGPAAGSIPGFGASPPPAAASGGPFGFAGASAAPSPLAQPGFAPTGSPVPTSVAGPGFSPTGFAPAGFPPPGFPQPSAWAAGSPGTGGGIPGFTPAAVGGFSAASVPAPVTGALANPSVAASPAPDPFTALMAGGSAPAVGRSGIFRPVNPPAAAPTEAAALASFPVAAAQAAPAADPFAGLSSPHSPSADPFEALAAAAAQQSGAPAPPAAPASDPFGSLAQAPMPPESPAPPPVPPADVTAAEEPEVPGTTTATGATPEAAVPPSDPFGLARSIAEKFTFGDLVAGKTDVAGRPIEEHSGSGASDADEAEPVASMIVADDPAPPDAGNAPPPPPADLFAGLEQDVDVSAEAEAREAAPPPPAPAPVAPAPSAQASEPAVTVRKVQPPTAPPSPAPSAQGPSPAGKGALGILWAAVQVFLVVSFLVVAVVVGRGGDIRLLVKGDVKGAFAGPRPALALAAESAAMSRRRTDSGLEVAVVTGVVRNGGTQEIPGARIDVRFEGSAGPAPTGSGWAWSTIDGLDVAALTDLAGAASLSSRSPRSSRVGAGEQAPFVVVVAPAPPEGARPLVEVVAALPPPPPPPPPPPAPPPEPAHDEMPPDTVPPPAEVAPTPGALYPDGVKPVQAPGVKPLAAPGAKPVAPGAKPPPSGVLKPLPPGAKPIPGAVKPGLPKAGLLKPGAKLPAKPLAAPKAAASPAEPAPAPAPPPPAEGGP